MAMARIARTLVAGSAALFLLTAGAAGQATGPATVADAATATGPVRFPEGRNAADIITGQDPASEAKNKAVRLERTSTGHPTSSPMSATIHSALRKLW